MNTKQKIVYLSAIAFCVVVFNYILFKMGHPQVVWMICDVLKQCQ